MRIPYIQKNFRGTTLQLIERANSIIEEYEAQGIGMNLRQLYYQFVARDIFENTEKNYKRLVNLVSDARLSGAMSWYAIEDRTRNLIGLPHWETAPDFIEAVLPQFRVDMWENQPTRVEVWVEKEALVNTIDRVCRELDVPYMSCRGYMSQSEEWSAGRRIRSYWRAQRQETIIIYLGDHDPSGLDMSRDHTDRLRLFAERPVEVRRIALNYDQIEQYNPPPNPAKMTDSRAAGYCDRFGESSWELDALSPRVMAQLVRAEIESIRDVDLWAERRAYQESERAKLAEAFRDDGN